MQITFNLEKKQYLSYQELISKLVDLKYQRVEIVLEPGEFAIRGNICDVFPCNHFHPIRIEYYENEIERLTSFNIHSQRSISELKETVIQEITDDKTKIAFTKLIDDYQVSEQILAEIKIGDYVVHEDHGIGIYQGLKHLVLGKREGEYALITYLGEDKLYVPIEKINRISLYSVGEIKPKINALSDNAWQKTKAKAKKALEELAEDIYLLYKTRENIDGFAFNEDSAFQIDLEQSFPHQATADQLQVIAEIKKDMENEKPMDRVITGDVGYGKTEVILRAAFKAAENNKQVAVLVPTTILAEQHFHTFQKRFKDFLHKVEVISRFKTKEEQKSILEKLGKNEIKVIIGTHRLLSKDVVFADLGLLIIDEEQRFGVSHKERIKQLKTNIDVISVSATPIPRTLYMALTGSKDFSILKTAPINRKPILTIVAKVQDDLIKKAVNHEIKNKGQVFYLFNNVQKIYQKFNHLTKLFPNLRIGVGHGQMKEHELEQVLHKFINYEYDILLCTTIIENGIDIPNANTIIMENVHLLGLAEIHQIRGRVGRTEKQAYAYLLYPEHTVLNPKAKERLRAIQEYAALGSGYKLALKDLEIRGAGTLLGKKQSGYMTAIGFDLYCKLLEESVNKFKKDSRKIASLNFLIDTDIKSIIPNYYISHERERLAIYRRLMNLMYKNQLMDLISELEDRYGKLPKEIKPLFNSLYDQLLEQV